MPRPLVSVIMPVYNGATHLRETLDSVLGQTLRDLEIVAVDDASTDDSTEILHSYAAKDDRLRVFGNPANLGHGATSNKALELARGRYIARQDQDDISLPERLRLQVGHLESSPQTGLLATSYYRMDGSGARRLRTPPQHDTDLRWRHLFGCAVCHSTVMLRSELFRTGELRYAEKKGANDYDLWVRLMRHTKGATLSEATVVYREHDLGMLAQQQSEVWSTETAISATQIRALLPKENLTDDEIALIRSCRAPRVLNREQLGVLPLLITLFDAFEQAPFTEPLQSRQLREMWVQRALTAAVSKRSEASLGGVLPLLAKAEPAAVVRVLTWRIPLWMARKVGSRLLPRRRSNEGWS